MTSPKVKRKQTLRKKAGRKEAGTKFPQESISVGFDSGTWQGILFWYSMSFYDIIQSLGFDKAKEIAEAAGNYSLEYPLWVVDKKVNEFKQFTLPYIGEKSGPYLIAIQGAFIVWTQEQVTNNSLPDSPILKACEDGLRAWKLLREPEHGID